MKKKIASFIFTIIIIMAIASSVAVGQNCPHGEGYYCGSSVQKTSNYLYYCDGGKWNLSEVCDHGCFVASAGRKDVCLSAPGAETSNEDSMLYGHIDPNATSCPQGHERNYCGELIARDPSKLYACRGAGQWIEKESCPAGCKATPSGHDDYCIATTACSNGDRFYCGSVVGRDTHHLYECRAGVYVDKGACPNGCSVTSDGSDDYCSRQTDAVPGFFINAYTVHMLKDHEGFHEALHQDEDEPQYSSIGYGHLCKPTVAASDCSRLPSTITENDATIILGRDVKPYERCVCKYISAELNAKQYGVLVAQTFERHQDCQYFRISKLRTLVNRQKFDKVPKELLSYAGNSTRSQQWYQDLANSWSKSSNGKVVCPQDLLS